MKIKLKNLLRLWIIFTFIFTSFSIYCVYGLIAVNQARDVAECAVEQRIAGLPTITVIEKEKEIVIEKPIYTYEFPFETEDLGTYSVKAACSDCLESREYSNMAGHSDITVFASSSVFPEGTLLWIEDVGIRQVQSIYTDYAGIVVYKDSHFDVDAFSEKKLRVFKVLE